MSSVFSFDFSFDFSSRGDDSMKMAVIGETGQKQRPADGCIYNGQDGSMDGRVAQECAQRDHEDDDEITPPRLEGEKTAFSAQPSESLDIFVGDF